MADSRVVEDQTRAEGRRMIDLRSDTVTKPTAAMRRAMAEAEVGDDVYGEDPTINRLEQRAAEILGKEAALFVPSGTMGNTLGVKIHTQHGEEVICEAHSHVMDWELAMMAWFSGCVPRTVEGEQGVLRWEHIAPHVRGLSPHAARTGLICLENTHNMAGGTVTPLAVMDEVCAQARERGIPVHLDGARIFNAAAAVGAPAAELARGADSVMFCLSKGLGAPVGSLLAGSEEGIARARLYRKRLGGGMRQAGVLAAAGLIALETMTARLSEDHENAQWLARGLEQIEGLRVTHRVETNIVIFDIAGLRMAARDFSAALKARGVLMNGVNDRLVRAVTHFDVSKADCEVALDAIAEVAREALRQR